MKNKNTPVTSQKPVHTTQIRPQWIWWLPVLLSFALYANTLGHGFVLDDSLVITKNKFTTQGISGLGKIFSTDTFFGYYQEEGRETLITGGRYRPLSLAFFAILFQVFGASPLVFHFF